MSQNLDPVDRRLAGRWVEQALSAVFEPQAVGALREDSPLSAIGLTAADFVCLADVIADGAAASGRTCVLDDGDVEAVHTVGDLIDAALAKSNAEEVAAP
jgi:hypothetical protein